MQRVSHTARRLWPVALELYRRWDRLPAHEKERYRRQAREAAERGREAYRRAQRRRGR